VSLKHKLVAVILACTGLGLMLLFGIVAVTQALITHEQMREQLGTLADLASAASAEALRAQSPSRAFGALQGLRAKPAVVSAHLDDANGRLFAAYARPGARWSSASSQVAHDHPHWSFSLARATITRAVQLNGEVIGSVHLEADLSDMYRVLAVQMASLLVGAAASLAAALVLASRLARHISGPIAAFVNASEAVSRDGDYETRVDKPGVSELDQLADRFNAMVSQIAAHEQALARHHLELEELVDQRTHALSEQTRNLAIATQRLSLALEGSQLALWDWDLTTGQVYLSEQWSVMRGGPPVASQLPFSELEAITHPDDRARTAEAIREALRSASGMCRVEERIACLDGSWKWIESHGKVVERDTQGRATRVIGTNADITEHKRSEAELRAARDAAETASRVKSQFLANMSHEIRTPMNGILGVAELLLATRLDREQQHLVRTVQRSSEHLLEIINDILDFSKIEAGKVGLELVPMPLRTHLQETIALFAERAAAKRVTLSLDVDDAVPPMVTGDPVRIRQVLSNLLSNAIKFTDRGSIWLRCLALEAAHEAVQLRFEVQDSGIGIPADARAHIFEPFSQADGSTTRRFGGTGLGLSIVRQLVELMGGRIGLESVVGRGSKFWFVLRMRTAEADATEGAAAPEAMQPVLPALNGHLLVVEDNAVNQLVVQRMLQGLGCTSQVASDGAFALDALRHARFDAILMDCQMPTMDGYTLTGRIRAHEGPGEHVPIIALTANALEGDRDRCLAAGMDDYLSKPFRQSELAMVLARWLPQQEQARMQQAPTDQCAALDEAALNAIRELDAGDAAGLLGQVVDMYLQASPPLIDHIRQGLGSGDADRVRMAAHTLKSSSANLGARRLSEMCAVLEHAARKGALSGELPGADQIVREFDAVRRSLERMTRKAAA
jgi:signal transduction histidine kinase/CheY-like chemotaxis protein/HPt (histidine-containing phosphotransfer) domain-containing protein